MKIDFASSAAISYLVAPVIFYSAFFISTPISIICVSWIIVSLFYLGRRSLWSTKLSPVRWSIIAFISLLWLSTAGLLPPFVFLGDWIKHFAVLNLLRDCGWPPTLPGIEIADKELIKAGAALPPVVMHYYVGWQLIPGLIAKLLHITAGLPLLLIWSLIGISIAFALIFRDERSSGRLATKILIFVFFSTPDLLGYLLVPQDHYWPRPIMEWWAGDALFQYSSMTTLIQGPIQHAIPAMLLVGLLSGPSAGIIIRYSALLFASAALWSPFAAIGAVPFLFLIAIRQRKISEFFNPWNVVTALLLASALGVYFLSGTANSVPAMLAWHYDGISTLGLPPFRWSAMLLFLVIEVALPAAILLPATRHHPKRHMVWLAVALLVLIPFYRIGFGNDWTTRVSIPALMFLAIATANVIVEKGPMLMRAATALLFLIGTATPIVEIYQNAAFGRVPGAIETLPNKDSLKISEIFGEPEPLKTYIISQLFAREKSEWIRSAKVCLPAGLVDGQNLEGKELQPYLAGKDGWGQPESWGIWSVRSDAFVQLPVYARDFAKGAELTFKVVAFTEKGTTQDVVVYINKKKIANWAFSDPTEVETKVVSLEPGSLSNEGPVIVRFEIPTAVSPKKLQIGEDARELGLGIVSIEVSAL